jgi:hypothetical protein
MQGMGKSHHVTVEERHMFADLHYTPFFVLFLASTFVPVPKRPAKSLVVCGKEYRAYSYSADYQQMQGGIVILTGDLPCQSCAPSTITNISRSCGKLWVCSCPPLIEGLMQDDVRMSRLLNPALPCQQKQAI